LIEEYTGTSIGIVEYTPSGHLREKKKAIENKNNFDFDCIFKLLHKGEYLQLVSRNFGFVPEVPNTKIFRVCYDLLKSIDIIAFQRQVLNILKKRNLGDQEILKSERIPEELRYICYTLNFDEFEYEDFCSFLNQKV